MKSKPYLKGLLMGVAVATLAAACVSQPADSGPITESTPGAQKGVTLMGAWVDAGAPNGSFTYTDLSGNEATGTFDADILPLFTTDDIWGDGLPACNSCHFGIAEDSYHEMGLGSYADLMTGGDTLAKPPGVSLLGESAPGAGDFNWGHSKMRSRLRDNRMPPGVEFDITEENRDGPCVEVGANGATVKHGEYGCENNAVSMLGAWVDAGAPENASVAYGGGNITWTNDILPMFTTDDYWGEGLPACNSCHFGIAEDSYHEMGLGSYKDLMTGGDTLAKPPGVSLLGETKPGAGDFNWGHSKMRDRLRNNRMPPGIEFDITEENRDGPIVLHGKR